MTKGRLHAKKFNSSQKAVIAARLMPFYSKRANARQVEAGKQHGKGQGSKVPEKIPEPKGKDARDEAGKAVRCD